MDASMPYDGSGNLVEEIRCNSAEEFLKAIEPRWGEITSPDFNDLQVYRGHNDAAWELLPAAWRKDGKEKLAPLREWLAPYIKEKMSQNPQFAQWSPIFRESNQIMPFKSRARYTLSAGFATLQTRLDFSFRKKAKCLNWAV